MVGQLSSKKKKKPPSEDGEEKNVEKRARGPEEATEDRVRGVQRGGGKEGIRAFYFFGRQQRTIGRMEISFKELLHGSFALASDHPEKMQAH